MTCCWSRGLYILVTFLPGARCFLLMYGVCGSYHGCCFVLIVYVPCAQPETAYCVHVHLEEYRIAECFCGVNVQGE